MSAFLSVYVSFKMEQPSLLVTEKLHHKRKPGCFNQEAINGTVKIHIM